MLNLSDKELDRFSKEAAEEYEPGDVLGPRSWDRLEVRMTQEFGRPGWNPIRHFRRFPYYYAPALLFLMGVTYYLVRSGASSGSSPGKTAKMPTQKTSVQPQNSVSDKNTSTPPTTSEYVTAPSAGKGDGSAVGGRDGARDGNADGVVKSGGADGAVKSDGSALDVRSNGKGADGVVKKDGKADGGKLKNGAADENTIAVTAPGNAGRGRGGRPGGKNGGTGANGDVVSGGSANANGGAGSRRGHGNAGSRDANGNAGSARGNGNVGAGTAGAGTAGAGAVGAGGVGAGSVGGKTPERELTLSLVQGPHSLGRKRLISDSALRAFNAKSTLPTLIKGKGKSRGLEISRKWQFGLLVAPDFTSVKSLAGDKAGSSIGLTVDYNFAPHWYLSSGILATRKNYAARGEDYHAPPNFYQGSGIFGYVDLVKGSFYMMEIPLNLRYDFSVAGSTLFFISAGSSSYLMTNENANLYWRRGGLGSFQYCSPTDHLKIKSANLFAAVNLSAGVETGLSNSLSLLIAPYMKLPTKNLGFGQVQMNSVGINFGLKWAPVTSRTRHH